MFVTLGLGQTSMRQHSLHTERQRKNLYVYIYIFANIFPICESSYIHVKSITAKLLHKQMFLFIHPLTMYGNLGPSLPQHWIFIINILNLYQFSGQNSIFFLFVFLEKCMLE